MSAIVTIEFLVVSMIKHPVKHEWYIAFALMGMSNYSSRLETETAILTYEIVDSDFHIHKILLSSELKSHFIICSIPFLIALLKLFAGFYFSAQLCFHCISKLYSTDQQSNLR